MEGHITMSTNELDEIQVRAQILKDLIDRRIKTSKAAKRLGLSIRQTLRLKKKFKAQGPKSLISKKIGARSNRQLPQTQKDTILTFFNQENHRDFGPTLAHEYLVNDHALEASVSSVRAIMIQNGLWCPNEVRKVKIYRLRPRRSKKGELVQLDGSEHDWFEGRGSRCTLLVFIDDATSETLHLKFVKSENTFDYFKATREYIEKCGRPETFYPDKHSVFRVNHIGALSGDGRTQFGRALEELGIQLICANSPQAKGRVERRNRDFQNRLVKAMRLAKICTIEAANAFLPSFLDGFNKKFAKDPQDPFNAHKPLLETHNLDKIFSLKYKRHLSKSLTLQYNNVIYQVIMPEQLEYTLRKAEVMVIETKDGKVSIECRGKTLTAVPYHKMQAQAPEVSSKELMAKLMEAKIDQSRPRHKPGRRHPWKCGRRGFSKRALETVFSS
jgi:transposase